MILTKLINGLIYLYLIYMISFRIVIFRLSLKLDVLIKYCLIKAICKDLIYSYSCENSLAMTTTIALTKNAY